MIAPDVDPAIATAIADILMDMDDSEAGQELLEIVNTVKFDEFPGGADTVFAPIREMYDIVTGE